MSTESDHTTDHVNDNLDGSESTAAAEDETGSRGANGRWLIAVVVLVLLVYPAARWMLSRGGTGAPPAAGASQTSLQLSFEHYQAGRYEEAIAAAQAALKEDPDSADAYNNLAVSYMGLKRTDEAIQAAENAIRLRPDFQLARNNLAWFQGEKAKAGLPTVPKGQADQAVVLLNQSLEHAQARRFRECTETARQATVLDPGLARAFNNAGFCAANLQRWDEAIRYTQEAIRLDPGLQLARNNLAWMEGERLKAGGGK